MSFQLPEYGMLSLAMMLAMVTGGIDLSIVQITVLSGILAGRAMEIAAAWGLSSGWIIGLAIVVALCSSALLGVINGLFIGFLGLEPILVTLGTSQVFLGIATVTTKGGAVTNYPAEFIALGNGVVCGAPLILLVFALAAVVCTLVLRRTRLGFNMFAIGSSKRVAVFSGIDAKRVLFSTYTITGLLSGMAAIIVMSRTNSIRVGYGDSYLLLSVLVVVLGGVDPAGGSGRVSGVIMSIVILQIISSGFNIIGYSAFLKTAMWGTILVGAMIANYFGTSRSERGGRTL